MSRHRFVRNINIHDELDDGAYDEADAFEGITPEQQVQLDSATETVMGVMGQDSFIREDEVKHSLWDNYFDIGATVDWALGEQAKRKVAKEKRDQKAAEKLRQQQAGSSSKPATPKKSPASTGRVSGASTPTKGSTPAATPKKNSTSSTSSTPLKASIATKSQLSADMAGLNIEEEGSVVDDTPPPKMSMAKEKVIEEAKRAAETSGKKTLSLVIVGHVDAGKSTLMGRLLYDLGQMEEKRRRENERESSKMGKGSFMWAWEMDALGEERERGVTIDINQSMLNLPKTDLTILDAPGHKDFVPNMISGASQADAALLVIDATVGEFEAGFAGGGQSREHVILVRSLGVSSLVVAVNKLDMVAYSQDRFEEICDTLKPFLQQSGYQLSKVSFVPCAGMAGVNLVDKETAGSEALYKWWSGPTLVEALDALQPPTRALEAPLRIPISNVFKGGGAGSLGSGVGVSGRLASGVVQVGERLRVLPGDETAVVRTIEHDDSSVPWAAAGSNVTLYLMSIDPVHVNIGTVLCPPTDVVPLASSFVAQVIIFDTQVPITSGASVELFHHSRDMPATISKLYATLDRATGNVVKANPRVLTKGVSAKIEVTVRSGSPSAPSNKAVSIPIETFANNKDMGRILIRRNGETIAAGIVLELSG